MHIILHNLKAAAHNLMKYRLQTLISVVSIAIGIVTLAIACGLDVRLGLVFHKTEW